MPKSFTLSFLLIEDSLNLWFCIEVMSRFSLSETTPNIQKGEIFVSIKCGIMRTEVIIRLMISFYNQFDSKFIHPFTNDEFHIVKSLTGTMIILYSYIYYITPQDALCEKIFLCRHTSIFLLPESTKLGFSCLMSTMGESLIVIHYKFRI